MNSRDTNRWNWSADCIVRVINNCIIRFRTTRRTVYTKIYRIRLLNGDTFTEILSHIYFLRNQSQSPCFSYDNISSAFSRYTFCCYLNLITKLITCFKWRLRKNSRFRRLHQIKCSDVFEFYSLNRELKTCGLRFYVNRNNCCKYAVFFCSMKLTLVQFTTVLRAAYGECA